MLFLQSAMDRGPPTSQGLGPRTGQPGSESGVPEALLLRFRRGKLGVRLPTGASPGQPCCSSISTHSWLPARRA